MPTLKKFLLLPIFAIACLFTRIDSFYAETCGIPSLDTSIDGNTSGYTKLNGNTGSNESKYGMTTGSGQWAIQFSYGTVWGMANCNTTNGGSRGDVNDNLQTESSGQYCWCQATGFTADGNSYTSGPQCTTSTSSSWVFNYDLGSVADCVENCVPLCAAAEIHLNSAVRAAMFRVAGYVPTVSLNWYDGNTQMSGGPSSCTVGGTFLPPTPPARPGYVFTGWKIKKETCGIPSLDTSINGTAYGWQNDSTGAYGPYRYNASNYGITTDNTWATEFSYGTVWGMANCNTTAGVSMGDVNNNLQTESNGQYCWCQATGFTTSGNAYTSGPQCTTTASNSWVFEGSVSPGACAYQCADFCAEYVQRRSSFRDVLFNAVGQ